MEGGDEFIEVKVTSPHKVGLTKKSVKQNMLKRFVDKSMLKDYLTEIC